MSTPMGQSGAAAAAFVPFNAERLERVYHFIEERVHQGQLPGAAIQIGRHGRFLTPRAFGGMGGQGWPCNPTPSSSQPLSPSR
ncbi:MAG: hypothetical protein R2932_27305 [Caldilineaceae bacterium]